MFMLVAALLADVSFAGYPANESWIPVVGRVSGLDGRGFYTTVYLTEMSRSTNDVTISFFPAGQPNVTPRSLALQLGPSQTGAVEVGTQLTGEAGAIGSLHLRSTGPLIAQAHVYTRMPDETPASERGTVLNAIPTEYAIGTGETTIIHVPAGTRYKLYAAETNGYPLYFSIRSNSIASEHRLYLGSHEQRSWDLADIFPAAQVASLAIEGINGSGKIVVAGTSIASESQDFSAYEMSLATEPRHRMRWSEAAAYIAVALALAVAAVYRMKTRTA
jgi:hypothetical protein